MNRRIRNLEDEYAKLWQMYGDLENERDRLREALGRIDAVTYTHDHEYGLTLARIARDALKESGDA